MWYNKNIMGLFRSLFGEESYLGVEIGTTSIKVVEVTQTPRATKLKNYGILETYGYLERFNDALQTSSLKALESEISAYLRIILQHAKIKSKKAVAALPAFSAFTTLIELPDMPPAELDQAIQFQAKQYVPLPISVVKLDYLKVGERIDENGNKLQQIFLISIPNEQIERYQKIFSGAGLRLMALEIEGMSLARVLTRDLKEPTLIIDMGSRSTSFAVAKEGFLKFEAQTDFAGGSLTQSIAAGLNVAPRRAEELKKQFGLKGGDGEQELSTLTIPILDVIINEGKRARDNFERLYKEKITSVVLVGGGANMLGIDEFMSKRMGLPVKRGNPFEHIIYPPELEPLVKELGPIFAVAIGLSIKPFK